jgi:dienelactone hydrolase
MSTYSKLGFISALILSLTACQTTGSDGLSFKSGSLGAPNPNADQVFADIYKPTGRGPFPAVILLHTCGGVKPHVSYDWPNFLTNNGYVVLTIDTMGSRGYSTCAGNIGSLMVQQAEDAFGGLNYLKQQPFIDGRNVAVMGFSLGAMAINSMLISATKEEGKNFKAAISLYGHCRGIMDKPPFPLMEIAADKDSNHMPSCVDIGKTYPSIKVHLLPNTYHAFDQQTSRGQQDNGGSTMYYSASAHGKAEELSKIFLAKHLK